MPRSPERAEDRHERTPGLEFIEQADPDLDLRGPGQSRFGAEQRQGGVATSIPDPDLVAHNGEWTPSNTETAACGPGEALLGSGFNFSAPSNGQTSLLKMLPVINGPAHGVVGQFMSDTGGTTGAQVLAICLK